MAVKQYGIPVIFILLGLSLFQVVSANALSGHASSYLAMHGKDPVDWHEWNAATLDKARRQGKMLFVSVGYFSCHWCHVMQRESYQDQEIAADLNKHYISVKVDRELNPVLDRRLINFVRATSGRAGWPLNVFLTPEGYPVSGLVYAPPARFLRIVRDMQQNWTQRREELSGAAKEVAQIIAVSIAAENQLLAQPLASYRDAFITTFIDLADPLQGGFGAPAKFPVAPQLQAALNFLEIEPNPRLRAVLELTLDKMARLGLQDHVGGGFFRYTVDPDWETPHYEKMLYTNALLARIYLQAGKRWQRADYIRVARQTLDFMLREMAAGDGAFIASLSAVDAAGEEGGYYLWTQSELKRIFQGDALNQLYSSWNMLRTPDENAAILPHEDFDLKQLAAAYALSEAEFQTRLEASKQRLIRYREEKRTLPRDDKRLAGWNGLALAALAEAAGLDPKYQRAGQRLARFIEQKFWQQNRLQHAVDQHGNSLGVADLFDHAAVAWGLMHWHRSSVATPALTFAERLIDVAWRDFYSARGWQNTRASLLPDPVFQRHLRDSALPSAEGLLLQATQLLLAKRASSALASRLEKLLGQSTESISSDTFAYATTIDAAVQSQQQSSQ